MWKKPEDRDGRSDCLPLEGEAWIRVEPRLAALQRKAAHDFAMLFAVLVLLAGAVIFFSSPLAWGLGLVLGAIILPRLESPARLRRARRALGHKILLNLDDEGITWALTPERKIRWDEIGHVALAMPNIYLYRSGPGARRPRGEKPLLLIDGDFLDFQPRDLHAHLAERARRS